MRAMVPQATPETVYDIAYYSESGRCSARWLKVCLVSGLTQLVCRA